MEKFGIFGYLSFKIKYIRDIKKLHLYIWRVFNEKSKKLLLSYFVTMKAYRMDPEV